MGIARIFRLLLAVSIISGQAPVRGAEAAQDDNPLFSQKRSMAYGQAREMEKRGMILEAMMAFKLIVKEGLTEDARDQARLGVARCLIRLSKSDPKVKIDTALNALQPIPDEPATEIDRRKLALAGEILIHMERPELAESALEVALAGLAGEMANGEWHAPTCANLGSVYWKTGKPRHALAMLQRAARLFLAIGQGSQARQCEAMAADISSWLDGRAAAGRARARGEYGVARTIKAYNSSAAAPAASNQSALPAQRGHGESGAARAEATAPATQPQRELERDQIRSRSLEEPMVLIATEAVRGNESQGEE